jgi:hypothetical protein
LKFFIDENWVYFYKNAALYKSPVDSYGFFNTEHGVPVDFCQEAKDYGRAPQLERLRSLLMPKPELSDEVEQMVLF